MMLWQCDEKQYKKRNFSGSQKQMIFLNELTFWDDEISWIFEVSLASFIQRLFINIHKARLNQPDLSF